ncbi:MAG: hypothetical protein RIR26_2381 [Pseudomonadota bacterium]
MTSESEDIYKLFHVPQPPAFGNDLDILIVDAEMDVRLILTHHLQKVGYKKVRVARDILAAHDAMRQQPAHVLLVSNDFTTPSASDFMAELRDDAALQKDVVVLITFPLNKPEIMLALETGFYHFIIKPIIPNTIVPNLKKAYEAYANPKNPERIYDCAKDHLKNKKYDEAKQIYLELSRHTATAARPHIGLAQIALAEGNTEEAIFQAKTAIQKNSNSVYAHAFLGDLWLRQGQLDDAVASYKTAIELSPLNILRYKVITEKLIEANRMEEASTLLEIAIGAGVEHPFINERLGYCSFRCKYYPKALKYLQRAVHAEPENISYLNSLAICYRDSGKFDEALDIYNKILKHDNDNSSVMYNKSLLLILMERKEDALKLLHRIVAKHPDHKKAKEKIHELAEDLDGTKPTES